MDVGVEDAMVMVMVVVVAMAVIMSIMLMRRRRGCRRSGSGECRRLG